MVSGSWLCGARAWKGSFWSFRDQARQTHRQIDTKQASLSPARYILHRLR